jgi:hypothetical protein
MQMLQSELKACQQRQQQQASQYESAIAVLQADVAALRDRLEDSQQHTRTAVDHLRSSTALQIEKQAQETEEQLQVRTCLEQHMLVLACLCTQPCGSLVAQAYNYSTGASLACCVDCIQQLPCKDDVCDQHILTLEQVLLADASQACCCHAMH